MKSLREQVSGESGQRGVLQLLHRPDPRLSYAPLRPDTLVSAPCVPETHPAPTHLSSSSAPNGASCPAIRSQTCAMWARSGALSMVRAWRALGRQLPPARLIAAPPSAARRPARLTCPSAAAARGPSAWPGVVCSPDPQAAARRPQVPGTDVAGRGALAAAQTGVGSAMTSPRAKGLLRTPEGSPWKDPEKERGKRGPFP